MTRAARILSAAALVLVFACVAGWWFLLRPPRPDPASGRAWLAGFTELATSPRLLGARGPAALALFPDLGRWPSGGCVTVWQKSQASAPFVVLQRLELARLEGDSCAQAQVGELTTVVRQSEAVTPSALAERFTERFGPPTLHRDASVSGSIAYDWDALYGVHLRVEEPVRPGAADRFTVTVVRFYGAPTAVPSAAEGERWLNRTVGLLTGPELAAAHGMAAVRMVDGELVPDQLANAGGCPTNFMQSPAAMGPIAFATELNLDKPVAADCAGAGFSRLSFSVWHRAPVTVAALVQRIDAQLGEPVLHRDFERNTLQYEWKTAFGTRVGVSEFHGAADRLLAVRAWRD